MGGSAGSRRAYNIRRPLPLAGLGTACQIGFENIRISESKPLTDPPAAADPDPELCLFHLKAANLRIFTQILATRKFIKKPTPQKAPQNLKPRPPSAQSLDFEVALGSLLEPFFSKSRKR